MKRIAAALWRGVRRWKKTSLAAITLFVLLVVPIWPLFPSCKTEDNHEKTIFRYMSPEYRYMLTTFLGDFGVYYWNIGGIVFVRVLPFLDGAPDFDQYDGIINAQNRAASSLAVPNFVISPVGHDIVDGRTYQIPDFILTLIENYSGDRNPPISCTVMPYIVTMEPPPKPRP